MKLSALCWHVGSAAAQSAFVAHTTRSVPVVQLDLQPLPAYLLMPVKFKRCAQHFCPGQSLGSSQASGSASQAAKLATQVFAALGKRSQQIIPAGQLSPLTPEQLTGPVPTAPKFGAPPTLVPPVPPPFMEPATLALPLLPPAF